MSSDPREQGCARNGGDTPCNPTRRRMLAAGAGLLGLSVAPGVFLMQAGATSDAGTATGASPRVRWGLLIDTTRCAEGCDACVRACREENGWAHLGQAPTDAQWIRKVTVSDPDTGHSQSLPVMCQHCAHPPCVQVCPTGASMQRADGIVQVDKHLCIGCRYCMMACPYKARSFVHEPVTEFSPNSPRGKGTVESCHLCVHRIDRGQLPACVTRCASEGGGAMVFGDLNDPDSDISQALSRHGGRAIRQDLGLNPGVRYQGI
ncbi:sulfate reduction electron transfer complex DsrMKJOP subunit DsrO [Alkalilimnicola ehrlichii MLHE-1]|uniref:4Fe-4S ferredoxin, iron-sulfur binding domain protein n=1 Tax=Alkalilimnicola ehrlichii (strain ATCC BAA-1101 / DSM 17681 / MLHE-1) TaxID=187272 RepID=Q0A828_ALKEH|nr:4Fe-4S ferredoxin, iron-sulfur binding domain protein [Alkalilimnicola ehrlichii MLHE-1]